MENVQSGPPPKPDNLIVHVAKCLQEDIYWPHGVEISLRQPPINDDDHDSWDDADSLEKWYYIAYSVIRSVDKAKADTALNDLVATDKDTSND